MRQPLASISISTLFWLLFVGPATVSADTAIVGATVIDGNGGPPLRDATVVVVGERIEAVGPRASVQVPAGASIIDGTGGTSPSTSLTDY